VFSIYLFLQNYAFSYYLYFVFPTFFWAEIYQHWSFISYLWKVNVKQTNSFASTMISFVLSILLLETMVVGYFQRESLSVALFIISWWPFVDSKIK
jgi:phosphatidylinositol glycan class N